MFISPPREAPRIVESSASLSPKKVMFSPSVLDGADDDDDVEGEGEDNVVCVIFVL